MRAVKEAGAGAATMNEGFQELPPVEANGRSARTAPGRDITARIELEPPSGDDERCAQVTRGDNLRWRTGAEIYGKNLELLKAVLPGRTRIGALFR